MISPKDNREFLHPLSLGSFQSFFEGSQEGLIAYLSLSISLGVGWYGEMMLYVNFLTQAFDILGVKLSSIINGDFPRYAKSINVVLP